MVTYLSSLVQLCCGDGGTLQISLACVRSARSVWTILGLLMVMCALPVYTAQAPGCSAGALSKAGLVFHVLPRSKPLRFMFSGTPQRHRLSWACVLCPSQVRAAQATRCLASALFPGWGRGCILSSPWFQLLGFLAVQWEHCLRCAVRLLWRADLWLRPS